MQHKKLSRKRQIKHSGESWAVSYVDMLTLLLCFFIIFFSFDKSKKQKEQSLSVLDKISSHFNPNAGKGEGLGEGLGPGDGQGKVAGLADGKGTGTGTGNFEGKAEKTVDGEFHAGTGAGSGTGTGFDGNGKSKTNGEEGGTFESRYAKLGQNLQKQRQNEDTAEHAQELDKIEGQFQKDHLQTKFKKKALVVEFPNVSFFDKGQSKLNKEGEKTVNYLLSTLVPYKGIVRIKVQGHTDPTPVTRKNVAHTDNWELSVLRATSVLKIFLNNGFSSDQLAAEGYADTQRIIASEGSLSEANHRRITLLVEEK